MIYLGCKWAYVLDCADWLSGHRLDGIVPNTPVPRRSATGSAKRKAAFETPTVPKFNKTDGMSSPSDARAIANTNGQE